MIIRLKKNREVSYAFLQIAILFYFSYYYITNSYMFELSLLPKIATLFLYGSMVLLVFSICSQAHITIKQLSLMLVLTILGYLVGRNVENTYAFAIIILFMLAGRGKEPEKIFKYSFWVNIIWLVLIVGTALLGIITNETSSTLTHPNRVYLGFTSPNASQLLFFCILLFISYKKNTIKLYQIVIFFFLTLWFFSYNDVSAALYYSCFVLLLVLGARLINDRFWKSKWLSKLSYIVIPMCIIITFLFPILYSKNVSAVVALDAITSTRISLSAQALEKYGVTLFGQLMNFNYPLSGSYDSSAKYFYIDSSYLKYILMYGAAFVAFILFLYHKMFEFAIRNKNIYLLIAAFSTLTYCIWNSQLLYITYNPFLMVLLTYLTKSKSEMEFKNNGET